MTRPINETLADLDDMEHASRRAREVIFDSARRYFRDIFDEKFKRVADDLAVPHSIRVVGDDDHLLVEVLRLRLAHPFETPPLTLPTDGLW